MLSTPDHLASDTMEAPTQNTMSSHQISFSMMSESPVSFLEPTRRRFGVMTWYSGLAPPWCLRPSGLELIALAHLNSIFSYSLAVRSPWEVRTLMDLFSILTAASALPFLQALAANGP